MAAIDNIEAAITKMTMGGIPSSATPFSGVSTVIASTTPVSIRAAVTGKRKWVTWIRAANPTPAEQTVIIFEDDTGTPVKFAILGINDPAIGGGGDRYQELRPPVEIASGKAILARSHGALGDSFAAWGGFEEA